jgi:hypothetical protein
MLLLNNEKWLYSLETVSSFIITTIVVVFAYKFSLISQTIKI